jgi:hypothetical protein
MPVWHVSVAWQTSNGPLEFLELRENQIADGVKVAKSILKSVGTGMYVFTSDPPSVAIHIQKQLTEKEKERLPEGWLEIPAIDDRGPCKVLHV